MNPGEWFTPKENYKVKDSAAPGYYILPAGLPMVFKRWDRNDAVLSYWYGGTNYLYSVFVPRSRLDELEPIKQPEPDAFPKLIWEYFKELNDSETAETETGQIKFEL